MALVSEAMERRVVTVPLDATVGDAAELARRAGVDHLLVLDGEALAGVLCTCDLGAGPRGELVAERMTLPVLTIRPDAPLEDAAVTMHECGVGCLPVVVGGLVLGLLEDARLDSPGEGRGAHARCHARRHRHPTAH